jgi:hypothetical protein
VCPPIRRIEAFFAIKLRQKEIPENRARPSGEPFVYPYVGPIILLNLFLFAREGGSESDIEPVLQTHLTALLYLTRRHIYRRKGVRDGKRGVAPLIPFGPVRLPLPDNPTGR